MTDCVRMIKRIDWDGACCVDVQVRIKPEAIDNLFKRMGTWNITEEYVGDFCEVVGTKQHAELQMQCVAAFGHPHAYVGYYEDAWLILQDEQGFWIEKEFFSQSGQLDLDFRLQASAFFTSVIKPEEIAL